MIYFLLSVIFIASGTTAQFNDPESCQGSELDTCLKLTPRTPVGLPRNKEELDTRCHAYQTGMACMDAWMKKCLPTDGQKFVQKQIGGARALMRFLCTNETALRKGFLKEELCWSRISPDWSRCVNELQEAGNEINYRAQQLTYFNRNAELCCARDEFTRCVTDAGRVCSVSASNLLKQMARVLAQDLAACSQPPGAYCSAPPSAMAAPLLTTIGVMLYPPRL